MCLCDWPPVSLCGHRRAGFCGLSNHGQSRQGPLPQRRLPWASPQRGTGTWLLATAGRAAWTAPSTEQTGTVLHRMDRWTLKVPTVRRHLLLSAVAARGHSLPEKPVHSACALPRARSQLPDPRGEPAGGAPWGPLGLSVSSLAPREPHLCAVTRVTLSVRTSSRDALLNPPALPQLSGRHP